MSKERNMPERQPIIPPHGKRVDLRDYSTSDTTGITKLEGEAELAKLRTKLNELQNLLFADERFALLVVLQAIDAGGKDGTINSVFRDVGPLGCQVVSFGVPSEEERNHDYLWRCHTRLPRKGHMTIFNRSYYEDVLVVRVRGFAPEPVWKRRYGHINSFEQMLSDEGTTIIKLFLHVSKDEQRRRLQERVDDPRKRWKFRKGDLEDRARWDEYQRAFEAMLEKCNTEYAPWHVIPADHNWYRDLLVARTVVERLESLGLRYPAPEEGVAGLKIT
jgi:PPK2 family polyphosphate:nucleotide phosphotransferase